MAQYERKNLNYIEGLDDDDPLVKNYDRICRILSYAAALAAVLLIRISGLLNSLPALTGSVLDLGGRKLEVIHIPGHTPGSIALLDVERRVLFSGDSVQAGNIFMFGPNREFHAYAASMERLEGLMDRFDVIYPSHSEFPVSPDLITPLKEAAKKAICGELPGETFEIHGRTVMRYDAGVAHFLGESGEVNAK